MPRKIDTFEQNMKDLEGPLADKEFEFEMENMPLYVTEGEDENRVLDPETARGMAVVEDSHRKKKLKLFKASEKELAEGERQAENFGEQAVEMSFHDMPLEVIKEAHKRFKKGTMQFDRCARGDLHNGVTRYHIRGTLISTGGREIFDFYIDDKDGKII